MWTNLTSKEIPAKAFNFFCGFFPLRIELCLLWHGIVVDSSTLNKDILLAFGLC